MSATQFERPRLNPDTSCSRAARHALELAECCFTRNWITEALHYDQEAMRLGLETEAGAFRRWACCMMLGEFEQAWQETDRSEARRRANGETTLNRPLHERRVWNGTPLSNKRVLVRCYHGLGDTIQFVRFLPKLCSIARSVTVQLETSLHSLMQSSIKGACFVPLEPEPPRSEFDVDIELMELPYAFRTALETVPASASYVCVSPEIVSNRAQELRGIGHQSDPLNVGLVWSSGNWNPERNISLQALAPLGTIPGVQLFSLQRGPAARELDCKRDGFNILPAERESGAPLDTAATILNLDVVISVDTMVAHLAGALGKPVWTLLPFRADWRWMVGREDSPWYPTMRLFRQLAPGMWDSVIDRVGCELLQAARSKAALLSRD